MSNGKDTSSKQQGKSSVSDNNISNKNVTHTQNLPPKTKSNNVVNSVRNSVTNSVIDEYKYIPGTDRTKSNAMENKRPSSGNIKGV